MLDSLTNWLRLFLPDASSVPLAERLLSALAAALGVLLVATVSAQLLDTPLFMVAAVGASACLVFCLPASPLAQPWSVIGGYLVSATAGVVVAQVGWPAPVAIAVAAGLAVFGMLLLRCLHAPGGAVALFAVLGGDQVHAMGFQYVLMPVAANALLLVAAALVINNLLPARHYPRRTDTAHAHRGFSAQHLHAALDDYGHALTMSEEELDEIITLAEKRAKASGRSVLAERKVGTR